jgi:hypothetical protein
MAMTYKELEQLVQALAPADATRLLNALVMKLDVSYDTAYSYMVRERIQPYAKGGVDDMEAEVKLLIDKLTHLPPERQAEVGDFIEFLHQRELAQSPAKDYARVSEHSFAKIWDNDDDAVYDNL